MNRHVLRDYLVGAASLLFTLVISCATPAAEAATARYDFQLQASALGAGGAFGIGALPAGPLQGHLAFSYDGTPDMLALIDVSDFSLSVGDVTFDTAGLVITLADFRPGIAGGPLASATLLALSDTRFVQIDTDAGWAAGSVFASDCLPGGGALGAGCIGGGIGDIHFASPVPEPSAALMAGIGVIALGLHRLRLRRRAGGNPWPRRIGSMC